MTEIKKVGVIGAGQMGNGIAQVAAVAGFDVIMSDISQEALDAGWAVILKSLGKLLSKERIDQVTERIRMASEEALADGLFLPPEEGETA